MKTTNGSFKIDFIGIGAEKSATTWVADCLAEHPQICFSKQKEIYFFNEYDPHTLKVKNLKYQRGVAWYKKHFTHSIRMCIKGEFSPTYLYGKTTARRIKKHFPNVKIVVVLRNPVERAFSQYIHDQRVGVLLQTTFKQAIKKSDSYIEKGLYYKNIKNYYKLFPKKNIHIIIYDDIKKNPLLVIRNLYKFLGVNSNYSPKRLNNKSFEAANTRFQRLNYFMYQTEQYIKKRGWARLVLLSEVSGVRKIAYWFAHNVNKKKLDKYPKMDKGMETKLKSVFEKDINKLEKLINRDLSKWKKQASI